MMEKLGVLESILKQTDNSREHSRSFNELNTLSEMSEDRHSRSEYYTNTISEDRNLILQIKLEKDEQENIKLNDEINLQDCHSRSLSNSCDYKQPSYQTYNFALCLDRSDRIKHIEEELDPALSPKSSRHIRKVSADIPIKKKHSLNAPFNHSRTPSPRMRSRSSLTPSPRLSPFHSNKSSPCTSLHTSPFPSPRPSPQPSPCPSRRLSPNGCNHTTLEASPTPIRRISLTTSPRLQNKNEKKNRRVGFSQEQDEIEQNNNNAKAAKTTDPVKQRKYSLPFFRHEKKVTEKPSHKKHARSISTVEVPRHQNEFYLEYDVNTMRKKSCIALTNPMLKNERSLKESVEECTNLVKAIEIAAYEISERENKKRRKQSKHDLNVLPDDSVKARLEEYKKSDIMISTEDRLDSRRRGISERCELERELVKQSVKYLIQNEFITLYKD